MQGLKLSLQVQFSGASKQLSQNPLLVILTYPWASGEVAQLPAAEDQRVRWRNSHNFSNLVTADMCGSLTAVLRVKDHIGNSASMQDEISSKG